MRSVSVRPSILVLTAVSAICLPTVALADEPVAVSDLSSVLDSGVEGVETTTLPPFNAYEAAATDDYDHFQMASAPVSLSWAGAAGGSALVAGRLAPALEVGAKAPKNPVGLGIGLLAVVYTLSQGSEEFMPEIEFGTEEERKLRRDADAEWIERESTEDPDPEEPDFDKIFGYPEGGHPIVPDNPAPWPGGNPEPSGDPQREIIDLYWPKNPADPRYPKTSTSGTEVELEDPCNDPNKSVLVICASSEGDGGTSPATPTAPPATGPDTKSPAQPTATPAPAESEAARKAGEILTPGPLETEHGTNRSVHDAIREETDPDVLREIGRQASAKASELEAEAKTIRATVKPSMGRDERETIEKRAAMTRAASDRWEEITVSADIKRGLMNAQPRQTGGAVSTPSSPSLLPPAATTLTTPPPGTVR